MRADQKNCIASSAFGARLRNTRVTSETRVEQNAKNGTGSEHNVWRVPGVGEIFLPGRLRFATIGNGIQSGPEQGLFDLNTERPSAPQPIFQKGSVSPTSSRTRCAPARDRAPTRRLPIHVPVHASSVDAKKCRHGGEWPAIQISRVVGSRITCRVRASFSRAARASESDRDISVAIRPAEAPPPCPAMST
jgi:hypothetical protein